MEKKIVIKNRISLQQFISLIIILIIILVAVLYMLFSNDNLSYTTRNNAWELIGVIFFIIPMLYYSLTNKQEYLSEIYILSNKIKLIYKIQNKISYIETIDKDNIKSINFDATINLIQKNKYAQINVCYKLFIDLIEGKDLNIDDCSDVSLEANSYKFIYKILEAGKYLPNFNSNIKSNNEIIQAEIDYYQRFGKKLPFWTRFKFQIKMIPLWTRIVLGISISCMLVGFSILIYANIQPNLTSTEREYIEIIKNSYNYKGDYDRKISEFDKAKKLISTDPYLYYLYAYNFKKKKDYHSGIEYAKQGISNLGNKEIYYKQYKFLEPQTDIYLYENLGDCLVKTGDLGNALSAYSYVVKSRKKAKYSSIYFKRGKIYYELKMYEEAKKDFLKHKDIIKDYIKTYSGEEWKWAKEYTNESLENINLWIKACNYSLYLNK